MTNINWTKIYTLYKGLWVALKKDEKTVIGSGKTASSALSKALAAGYASPILFKIPKKLQPFVGNSESHGFSI